MNSDLIWTDKFKIFEKKNEIKTPEKFKSQ